MGNATDTTAQAWMRENRKMQAMAAQMKAMATEIVEILYNMYNNGCHDQLRAGLGSVAFRALENYAAQRKVENAAQRKVENAALEEWLH
jgi:hypothetical protein